MKSKLKLLIFFALVLYSCKKPVPDTPPQHLPLNGDSIELQSVENGWLEYYASYAVHRDSFKTISTDTLPGIVSSFVGKPWAPEISNLLIYSPDSTRILDIYGYNFILFENELGQMEFGTEADTEVLLYDMSRKKRIRLLFVGPSVTVEDGFWLNDNEILLTGMYRESQDEGYRPVMWKVSVIKKTIQYFEYMRVIPDLRPEYIKDKKLVLLQNQF
jgi:hypothetical protein